MKLPNLEGERLLLRAIEYADRQALFDIFSDAEVVEYWSSPAMRDLKDAEALIAEIHTLAAQKTLFQWGIICDEKLIGTATLSSLDFSNKRAQIGYALRRDCWGRGYAKEAVTILVNHAFDDLDLYRIEADIDPRNARSIRMLQKLGFSWEGFLPERYRVGGGVQDTVLYGLLRSTWVQRQK